MTILEACEWLQNLSFPTEVRESEWLFPTIETIHVLALVLVIGSISLVDLRPIKSRIASCTDFPCRRTACICSVIGISTPIL